MAILRNPFTVRKDYDREKMIRDLRDLVDALNEQLKTLSDRVKTLEDAS